MALTGEVGLNVGKVRLKAPSLIKFGSKNET